MDIPTGVVVEPALFPSAAVAVSLQVLIDNLEHTVLFVVEAKEPVTQRLVGLWSSAPVGVEDYAPTFQAALSELSRQVWESTGPFA